MSNDKTNERPKTKSEILGELDRLKELLEKDRSDSDEDNIPVLNDVVEFDNGLQQLTDEAAASENKAAPAMPSGGKLPTGKELNKLVDMLVTLELRKLRPVIQKEVVRLILERYPDLK